MVNMSALTSGRDTRKDVGALAGLRATDKEETIELTSPCNTLIRTNLPTFSWVPRKPYDKFVVNLYNSKGLVWSKKVDKSPLSFLKMRKDLILARPISGMLKGRICLKMKNRQITNFQCFRLINLRST